MVKVHNMKKQKKESAKSFVIKDGVFGLTATPLNAKQRKAREPTGRMSTQKAQNISPQAKKIMQLMIDNPDPIFSVVPHTPGNARDRKRPRTLGEQDRQERAELLWRYKARGVIIQNLRAALTMAGFKISGNLTDTTLNISKSLYSAKSGLSIYARGPTKTSGKSLASYRKEAVDYAIKALRHNGL
jgi:hypothetical protein